METFTINNRRASKIGEHVSTYGQSEGYEGRDMLNWSEDRH